MLTPDAAWQRLRSHLVTLPACPSPLASATGRYLAEPITADRDLPPADRAAMDGFAVRAADLANAPTTLDVFGEVAAGAADEQALPAGACRRIYTGANLPADADCVVPVEATSQRAFRGDLAARVEFPAAVAAGANVLRRGENARAGATLLPAGTRLEPPQLGVAAGVGLATVTVHRLPRLAILTTGAELVAPGGGIADHQTRDSNGPALAAALAAEGFPVVVRQTVPDTAADTAAHLRNALAVANVIVITGGVSMGQHDYVPGAIAEVATIHYHGIAMKPGKPQLFASTAGDRALLFGLPGNPVSALCGLHEFVLPALRCLAGCPPEAARRVWRLPLATSAKGYTDRQRFALARLVHTDAGTAVELLANRGSADLVAAALADGTAILPLTADPLPAGTIVDFRPWRNHP